MKSGKLNVGSRSFRSPVGLYYKNVSRKVAGDKC